jgi:hypothetical protein
MVRVNGKFYRSPVNEVEASRNIGRIIHIPNFYLKSRWLIKGVVINRGEMCYLCDLVSSAKRIPSEWIGELISTTLCYIDDDGVPVGHEVTEEDLIEQEKHWKDRE